MENRAQAWGDCPSVPRQGVLLTQQPPWRAGPGLERGSPEDDKSWLGTILILTLMLINPDSLLEGCEARQEMSKKHY